MRFELVATDGSGTPNRDVDEAEARRLLVEQYGNADFLDGLKGDQVASVEGGILRRKQGPFNPPRPPGHFPVA